ncbi:MAG: hypothetical protein IJY33_00365, partial [Oscillospiraceae bacterium]|nr:hypothetical protein [Oscillospiraceae bacterium]
MKRKILAIILSAVMLVSALPLSAFALSYGTETELSNRTLGINFCNFNAFANNYDADGNGTVTDAEKLEEIKAVLNMGYVNQLFLANDANLEQVVELCVEKGIDFWYSPGRFNSSRVTIDYYIANVEYVVNKIRAINGYDNFLGFWWDEPLWNGMTNADFQVMTKALYEKWGKRNYIVEIPSVLTATSGVVGTREAEAMLDASLTYITDIGWDNYSWDVTTEDGKNEYNTINNAVIGRFESVKQDVYLWYYPCAYNSTVHSGGTNGRADQTYCNNHLNFFNNLLLNVNSQYAKAGGITLYTYANFAGSDSTFGTTDDTKGLSSVLPITVPAYSDGTTQLKTVLNSTGSTAGLWTTYAQTLKNIKTNFDNTKLKALSNVPFGSLDVVDATHDTITVNVNDGYEYSIDAGKNWQITGVFSGLKESTEYTITVKRTSDSKTEDFAVSTTERYPYSTGLGDTASYALKMPTELDHYNSDYGWISTAISRKLDSSEFYGSDSGYLHLVTEDNERFMKVQNDITVGNACGNATLYFYFGDQGRSKFDKGIAKKIDADNLTAFAIRMKTTGGTADQVSAFDFYIQGPAGNKKTENASKHPIQFLDKNTLTLSTLTFKGGINITGNVDGWIIIPFDAYPDLDGDAATTNLDWIRDNITRFQIFMHEYVGDDNDCKKVHYVTESSWVDKTWYIGDIMYVENVETFVLARQGFAGLPEGTVGYAMDVPEEPRFLAYNTTGTTEEKLCFNQWHTRFLMNGNDANAADPYNAASYPSSGGGLYIRNLDGESFMLLNPREVVGTTEYADGTNTVNEAYGKTSESNGKFYFNNISSIKNDSSLAQVG